MGVGRCCPAGEPVNFQLMGMGFLEDSVIRTLRLERAPRLPAVGLRPLSPAVGLTAAPLSSASCANQEDSLWGSSSLRSPCRRLGTALHLGRARWPSPSSPGPPQDLQRGAVPLDQQR